MDLFLKAAACAMITLVLCLAIGKQAKDIALLIGMIACIMIAGIAIYYLQPVISFFNHLQRMCSFDIECIEILLRTVGVGILAELLSLICIDAGNVSLGKTLQMSASAMVLWLSLPLFTKLISLIEEMLLLV